MKKSYIGGNANRDIANDPIEGLIKPNGGFDGCTGAGTQPSGGFVTGGKGDVVNDGHPGF